MKGIMSQLSNLVSEIKSLEEKLSEQANKEVVVIAYEKDKA